MDHNWFLNKREYKHAYNVWNSSFQQLSNDLIQDIEKLSQDIEYIFGYKYFDKYNSPFIEDVIWIASQVRIYKDIAIHKSVKNFINETAKVISDADSEKLDKILFHQKVNTIIAITIEKLKKLNNNSPSLINCVSSEELKSIKDKIAYFSQNVPLSDKALLIDESYQMKLLSKYNKSPNIKEIESKINILIDISISDSENANIASGAINYLLDTNDVIDDKVGILGLVDDMVAIEYGIKKALPNNRYHRLIAKHNKKYPTFDLPPIDSDIPVSLINLENIVKASYSKLEESYIKRLIVMPNTGPVHILCAVGKGICNRIDCAQINQTDTHFNKGEKIVIGEIDGKLYNNKFKKKVIVEFDEQCKRAPNLFYVKTSSSNERETISLDLIKDAKLCIDNPKLSSKNDLKKLKREDKAKYIPWGSMEFNANVRNINTEKKIFIFCKKNNLDKYLNEKFFGVSLKSWFGLRYFNNKFDFKDHNSTQSLFPEPMFYSSSNKDIAMEMIRHRWENDSVARLPDLIIVNEPTWLNDHNFLNLLKKCQSDVIITNDFFHKSNKVVKEYGFEEIAAKPDSFVSIDTKSFQQGLIEKYLLKSEPFNIQTNLIEKSILDDALSLFRRTKIFKKQEIFYIKTNVSRVLQSVRSRITPHSENSLHKLRSDLTNVAAELTFLANIHRELSDFSKFLTENIKNLTAIDRSKEITKCIKKIKSCEKTALIVKPAQFEEAKKEFLDENRNLKVVLTSNLESLNDFKNLIVPYFLGSEYSTKLRNFKYADNHIFLLSKSEEKIHEMMLRIEKEKYENYFSDNRQKSKSNPISSYSVEEEISYVDPSMNIFQQSVNIVSSNLTSRHDYENIDSIIFSLGDEKTLILPSGGSNLFIDKDNDLQSPEVSKVHMINVGDRIIIPESFSGGDILEAVLKSNVEKYAEYKKTLNNASVWREILKTFKSNNNLSIEDLNNELKKKGINRDIATVRNWLNNPSTIAPKNREDVIPLIFSLNDSNASNSESCLSACSKIYIARNEANKILNKSIEDRSIKHSQNKLKVLINEVEFNFNVYEIKSLADVSVPFKYLYHLRSYADLQEINT